jgi:integrase
MASIGREGTSGERKRILFRDQAGRQQSLRLGKCSEKAALSALAGFERVLESNRLGSTLHPDGVRWLESIDDRLHARVVAIGLAQPRNAGEVVTLGTLVDRFDATAAVKPGTRTTYQQATRMLREHFGADKPLASITPADADDWRQAIAGASDRGKTLAPATVAKRVKVAKQVFAKGVKWGWIASSPLADLRVGAMANPERAFYVTREAIDAILAACPDDEWRAIVGLCRYAGLRCPSEIVGLRWGDVNWERGRLTVRSPKTSGHEGHAVRLVPIAAELRAILQDLFDKAEPGTEAVVPRLRDPRVNLRTTFEKIIARAGEKPWPRLFHNMRASCETDWVDRFPDHVVASWLGHSPQVARTHYLQVRDAHFDQAASVAPDEAAAIPATHTATSDAKASNPKTQNPQNPRDLVGVGAECDPVESGQVTPMGFEPMLHP